MVETYTPTLMQMTDGAVQKILSLRSNETDSEILNLRVYVTGGGCSGFQYGFSFDKTVDEDDTGSKFIISNPNATTTCGCGESFSI